MTTPMQQLMDKLYALPQEKRDTTIQEILALLEDEAEWDRQFSESPDLLDSLADEALAEHRASRTKPLNFDGL